MSADTLAPDPLAEALSGTVAALVGLTATYPLITVNARQQTTHQNDLSDERNPFTRACATTLTLVEEEGVNGLFKGLKPAFIGTAISQVVYFYFYSNLRSSAVEFSRSGSKLQAAGYKANLGPLSALGVASVAGCLAVVLTNPIWVVASRLQAARKAEAGSKETAPTESASKFADPEGMVNEIQAIYEEDGLLGFWKGVPPALLMVSNPALQYMAYEWLSALRSKHDKSAPTAMQIFTIGASSKAAATVLTYPMLLVKLRLQSSRKQTDDKLKYSGTLDAVLRIVKEEGIGAFYEGIGTKLAQTVLAAALMYTIKEKVDSGVRKALRSGAGPE